VLSIDDDSKITNFEATRAKVSDLPSWILVLRRLMAEAQENEENDRTEVNIDDKSSPLRTRTYPLPGSSTSVSAGGGREKDE
jgi:hypothetical protein